jgi:hypothetical protein
MRWSPIATFQYRCPQDGDFEVIRPVGTATTHVACARCGRDAVRVFTAPLLSLAPRALMTAIDSTEKTRDEPEVISALPPRNVRKRTPMAPRNPALQRLPRP